jgi:class 3 adenylate cyclase
MSDQPEAEISSPKHHILVVDDIELNRDMLARRLKRAGFDVTTADGGEQALAEIGSKDFDLVLLDIMMPDISGIDVLKRVRLRTPATELPIIMATAKGESEDIVEALALGANDYVVKPLDFPVVLARMNTQLTLKSAMEQVQSLAAELEVRNRFIRKTFGRYLSDEVVAELLQGPGGLKLGGERREVTLLMADLRGFSPLASSLEAEQVVTIINNYLATMTKVIQSYGGTINEFIGDAILAFFGAPEAHLDDPTRAVACGVAMQLMMDESNGKNVELGLPPVEMGIGINTGEVVIGNIGSKKRTKYGAVGHHVNLTARIESLTVGGQVLVSQSTAERIGDQLVTAQSFEVEAKGIQESIRVHEVLGLKGDSRLRLEAIDEQVTPLKSPIPVEIALIQQAETTIVETGQIIAISARHAMIEVQYNLPERSQIRLRLIDPPRKSLEDSLYGKILAGQNDAGAKKLRFTWITESATEYFASLAT